MSWLIRRFDEGDRLGGDQIRLWIRWFGVFGFSYKKGFKGGREERGIVRLSALSSKIMLARDEARIGSEGRAIRNWFLPQEHEPWRGEMSEVLGDGSIASI